MTDTALPPSLVSHPDNPVPEGARVGRFAAEDGVALRYAYWLRSDGPHRGTICLLHGRTEFIEKYFETIADFRKRGFAVATFDWRGQGGSQRLARNPLLGYVDRFEDYWVDLKSFHRSVLLPDTPPPYYAVGHSMGGLVALHAAVRDRMMFDRLFLSAPMLGLDRQRLSLRGTARLADALCFFGAGQLPVGRRSERPPSERAFANNPLTSDFRRYMRSVKVLEAEPGLAIGRPAVRWVAAAMHAMDQAGTDSFPVAVKIPTLMLAAARDSVVSTVTTERLGLRMRTGRHVLVPAARHELFMEADAIRAQVLAAFDAFITTQSR
ncbi:lysophospholipase [Devosia enhydra]|uniref:Lysophospholipase n=1 Tax=Devosia enhydra TaxID=665118 RepID=A0A1K2I2V1_9HYPH|nr:alpha/beta hydrolase [Devosia enhydra]SFZ86657.1 lysophospholipase [Devosia enhydra]